MLPRPLALVLALATAAPALAQTSVWKVSRGGQSFYLGGTCHLLRAEDFPLPREFDQAFAASETLVFETDLGRMQAPETQAVILQNALISDAQTLDKIVTPAAWKKVEAYCAQSGLPLAQARRLRPWFFVSTIAVLELQKMGVSAQGVDAHFFAQAGAAKKKTGELETFEQQLNFLIHLGDGFESEMIAQTLDELGELPGAYQKMVAAWKVGDVAQIDDLFLKEMRTKYPAVFKSLMVERNTAWLPRLEAMLKTPGGEFVLVGAAHVAGPEGLIAQLRQRGCTVEQLRAKPAAAAK